MQHLMKRAIHDLTRRDGAMKRRQDAQLNERDLYSSPTERASLYEEL